jgi:hypothetical protein
MLVLLQLIKLFKKHNLLEELSEIITDYQMGYTFISDVYYSLDSYGIELKSSQLVSLKNILDDERKTQSAFKTLDILAS